jgi:hypothetical protein
LKLLTGLLLDMVYIVVYHGEGDADAEDGNQRKGDGRVGHELVGLFPVIGFHFVF